MSTDITHLITFRTASTADAVIYLTEPEQLSSALTALYGKPFVVLGEGSNVLFTSHYAGTVIVNQLTGINLVSETDMTVTITAASGENWHQFVVKMNQSGYHGLENLALIPGTVGAAPVQNIGAYGVEVAEFIESVTVYDLNTQTFSTLMGKDCGFAYRNSYFKHPEWRNRYMITAVTFHLPKAFSPVLSYQGLAEDGKPNDASALLARVIAVRQSKLPDPANLPNAGSFFKNPLVSREQLTAIQVKHPDVPYFDIDEHTVKIPAAWLLQTAGFKGESRPNGAGVYEKHALILVNRGGASGADMADLAHDMIARVQELFHITLTPEVRFIGSTTTPKGA